MTVIPVRVRHVWRAMKRIVNVVLVELIAIAKVSTSCTRRQPRKKLRFPSVANVSFVPSYQGKQLV